MAIPKILTDDQMLGRDFSPPDTLSDEEMSFDVPKTLSDKQMGETIFTVLDKKLTVINDTIKQHILDAGKGALRGVENIFSGAGATLQWFGESVASEDKDTFRRKQMGKMFGKESVALDKGFWDKVGNKLADWGSEANKFWIEEQGRGIEAPDPKVFQGSFMQNPSWRRATSTIAEAIPSLAAATVVTIATKNPTMGAFALGLNEGSQQYVEARQAGVEPKEATTIGIMSTVGNTILETVPLTRFLRGGSGKFTKDVFLGAIQEGGEEVLQALWTNTIAKIGYDETRDLTEGMVEGFIGGAGSGGMIGSITSGRGVRLDESIQKAIEAGVTPEELEQMQEAVANQIIANSGKIEKVISDSMPDWKPEVAKPTPESIEPTKVAPTPIEAPITPIVEGKPIPDTEPLTPKELVQLDELESELGELEGEEKEEALQLERRYAEAGVKKTAPAKKAKAEIDIKAKQIKGRLTKLDSDIKNVRKEIDILSKQKQGLQKQGKSTKQIESKIAELTKKEDVIDSERADLLISQKETITLEKEKIEITAQELLKNIERGVKEGTIKTKEDIKKAQTEVIDLLDKSELEAKDKAKFLRTIKNVQTTQQLDEVLPEITQRIVVLEEKADINQLDIKIKKELKATKPLKQGQRKVGKFDYDTNKIFDSMREANKKTKEQAQTELDSYPETANKEVDLIKKRFLSLKANGKSSSIEMFEKVHEDIIKMKELGRAVKDEAELYNKINRQDLVDEVITASQKVKGDRKGIKTRILNIYREGFSNTSSMLNSLFGKAIAEKYNPEMSEKARNTAVYHKTKEMAERATKIYDEKNILRTFEFMGKKEYKITDFEGLTTDISKLDLIDIYNSLKNTREKESYYNAYDETQITGLMASLTSQDEEFADYLQETVQGYREVYNKRHIETTGRDLGFVENYWPATSEYKANVFDDIRIQGETPSAEKERARGLVIPIPKNAWYKAQRHVAQGEHVTHLSREYEELKRLFTDRKVKHLITNKYGENVYRTLIDQIENISLNSQSNKLDAVSRWFGIAINNWVTAKVALNPSTYVRQLISVGNYMEDTKITEWIPRFFQGISNPRSTFNFMWENSPYLEARFNRGYSEALKNAIDGAERLSANWGSWTKFLSSLARSGDITAIIYGGYPLVKIEMAKGKTLKQAMATFEQASIRAQQSGLSSSLSQFQNSKNPFARLFLAFKNTSNQYSRKMADAVISYQNEDISLKQFAKTMSIYGVIQPVLYVLAGIGVKEAFKKLGDVIFKRDDEEEELSEKIIDEVMTQLVVSPVNAIPLLDDITAYSMRKATGQKVWKVFSTPLLDELETGVRALGKKEVTAEDYLKATASVLEPTTAAPINTFTRYYNYIVGAKDETNSLTKWREKKKSKNKLSEWRRKEKVNSSKITLPLK